MDASDSAPAAGSGTPPETRGETGSGDDSPGSKPGSSFLSLLFKRGRNGQDFDRPQTAADFDDAFAKASPAERLMIGNILRLRELRVIDVMTPRADIVAISNETTLEDATAAFERGGFSRLPVFRETLDNPIGFIHLKDLAIRYGVGCQRNGADFKPSDHLHEALFVPPSMGIVSLLQRMQGERVHMALVIDEFGGVDGLVTIEDLVEQIVGDIEDEHDTSDLALWREESPGVYSVSARADIEEFEEDTGVRLRPVDWEEDADTLGGLVFMLTGRVPARGEVIPHPLGHEFQVVDADPRRIKRLLLTVNGSNASTVTRPEAAE
ncbi:HlyC/CorC family transporter [Rhodobacteraceae bacterium NNCM2]|nr:HlyC/CorC family transporter [Coraliihabitans acroporae]